MAVKILLVGNGSRHNRGCEAITLGTLAILSKTFPDAIIENYFFNDAIGLEVDPCAACTQHASFNQFSLPIANPSQRLSWRWIISNIGKRIGPHDFAYKVYSKFQEDLSHQIQTADLALQVGGDNYSLDYGFPLLHASIDKFLSSKGIPVALWGASVGPFDAIPYAEKWMVSHFRKHMKVILAREPDSLDYLKKIGLASMTIPMDDPAFVMAQSEPKEELWKSDILTGAIGLNLSPLLARYRSSAGNMQLWKKEAADLIFNVVRKLNRQLILIPHVMSPGNSDYEFMVDALQLAGVEHDAVHIAPPSLTAPEIKWLISKLAVFVGARTHATIASFSSHVPTISIAYSIKAYGLNQRILGHRDYVIDAQVLSPERLISSLFTALDRADEIRERLTMVMPEVQRSAYNAGEALKKVI